MSDTAARSAAQIEADIARTRLGLGRTVESLTYRMDVKARSREKLSAFAAEVKASAQTRQAQMVAGVVVLVAVIAIIRKVRR